MTQLEEPKMRLMGENPPGWGSIEELVNLPPEDVAADETWCSVLGMWLFCPCNCVQGCCGAVCQCLYVFLSIGSKWICCSTECCSALGSVQQNRPYYLSYVWWRYAFGGLLALVFNSMSRLALFIWEWKAFGSGDNWFHGEGFWTWTWPQVNAITRSRQMRKSAFGCISACIPDLFPTGILIFLSNGGEDSEWWQVRKVIHEQFLQTGKDSYINRKKQLPSLIAQDWPKPAKLSDFDDAALVTRIVCKCVFYMMFAVWITDEEATTLSGWRTNATFFILPRLVQRFIFNLGINRVKQLRVGTVRIVEKYGLQPIFVSMNASLPEPYRKKPIVKFCDEIMYVIGFAGMGGTGACVNTLGAFLQAKLPAESATKEIDFGDYKTSAEMVAAYKRDPVAYIKESVRMDPPVTSATQAIKEPANVMLNGRPIYFPTGSLNQYVVSMANRDPDVFTEPTIFNPMRPNLSKAMTWNGAFGLPNDEQDYPRICPGRYLSLDVSMAIINHVVGTP